MKKCFAICILTICWFSLCLPSSFAEDLKELKERIKELEQQFRALESRAVLSEPEIIVHQKKIWVCDNGHEHEKKYDGKCPLDGLSLKKSFTFERERVYRKQTISGAVEAALADESDRGITIGLSGTTTLQGAFRVRGDRKEANNDLFGVGSLDLLFMAKPALYTEIFADLETIGSFSPDDQIANVSFLNGDAARRRTDRQVDAREIWLKTELFRQRLALSGGLLDLTTYFDTNTAANDEDTQFITDTLVNNPFLALPRNGGGMVAVFDPKTGMNFKAGIQRGENARKNLSEKSYSIFEVEYLANFGALPEGHYRAWYRIRENTDWENMAWGISADQKLTPSVTLFSRFSQQFTSNAFRREDYFYSGGLQFKTPYVFSLQDVWAVGFQRTDLASGVDETLIEGYYNLFLTDNIQTSLHLQYLVDSNVGGIDKSYILPGLRVHINF